MVYGASIDFIRLDVQKYPLPETLYIQFIFYVHIFSTYYIIVDINMCVYTSLSDKSLPMFLLMMTNETPLSPFSLYVKSDLLEILEKIKNLTYTYTHVKKILQL